MSASTRMVGFLVALLAACSFEQGRAAIDGAIDPDHCLDGWCARKSITIHGTVDANTSGEFMLLVRIANDPELAVGALANGNDIRFVASDGTVLPYARDSYEPATGALLGWVRLPALAPTDQTIYLYYGNEAAVDQQAGMQAWAARYAGVWHLDEAVGAPMLADATSNANPAQPNNSPTLGTPGVMGEAVTFDGIDDFLRVTQSPSLAATTGDATFALWINWNALTSTHYQRVLTSENRFTGTGDGYEWSTRPAGEFFIYPYGGAQTYNIGPNPFVAGRWQHLAATLDFTQHQVVIFVDGVPMQFTTENDDTAWTMLGMPNDWLWGSNIGLSGPFAGMMDEIQVMRGAQPVQSVNASYLNQKPDSTLLAIGPEQRLTP